MVNLRRSWEAEVSILWNVHELHLKTISIIIIFICFFLGKIGLKNIDTD